MKEHNKKNNYWYPVLKITYKQIPDSDKEFNGFLRHASEIVIFEELLFYRNGPAAWYLHMYMYVYMYCLC